ncbi:VanZ family protein [Paenibacillus humicola]|uniref:VanZ family protein n=1 Tax=Paenibacillus humicola TaxID=3110540 RepID=UPI00237A9647|nr:VanZ family protein [Paenibacillus humicola]
MSVKIRLLLVIAWAFVLFVLTCTFRLGTFLRTRVVHFIYNPHPNFREFFELRDINSIHHEWIAVKVGHLVGFFILDLLLYNLTRRKGVSLALAVFFALATEIFQLYFNRDGRLYDVAIDSLGILLSSLVIQIASYAPPASGGESAGRPRR